MRAAVGPRMPRRRVCGSLSSPIVEMKHKPPGARAEGEGREDDPRRSAAYPHAYGFSRSGTVCRSSCRRGVSRAVQRSPRYSSHTPRTATSRRQSHRDGRRRAPGARTSTKPSTAGVARGPGRRPRPRRCWPCPRPPRGPVGRRRRRRPSCATARRRADPPQRPEREAAAGTRCRPCGRRQGPPPRRLHEVRATRRQRAGVEMAPARRSGGKQWLSSLTSAFRGVRREEGGCVHDRGPSGGGPQGATQPVEIHCGFLAHVTQTIRLCVVRSPSAALSSVP